MNPFGLLYHEITAATLVKIDENGKILDCGTLKAGVNQVKNQTHLFFWSWIFFSQHFCFTLQFTKLVHWPDVFFTCIQLLWLLLLAWNVGFCHSVKKPWSLGQLDTTIIKFAPFLFSKQNIFCSRTSVMTTFHLKSLSRVSERRTCVLKNSFAYIYPASLLFPGSFPTQSRISCCRWHYRACHFPSQQHCYRMWNPGFQTFSKSIAASVDDFSYRACFSPYFWDHLNNFEGSACQRRRMFCHRRVRWGGSCNYAQLGHSVWSSGFEIMRERAEIPIWAHLWFQMRKKIKIFDEKLWRSMLRYVLQGLDLTILLFPTKRQSRDLSGTPKIVRELNYVLRNKFFLF